MVLGSTYEENSTITRDTTILDCPALLVYAKPFALLRRGLHFLCELQVDLSLLVNRLFSLYWCSKTLILTGA